MLCKIWVYMSTFADLIAIRILVNIIIMDIIINVGAAPWYHGAPGRNIPCNILYMSNYSYHIIQYMLHSFTTNLHKESTIIT